MRQAEEIPMNNLAVVQEPQMNNGFLVNRNRVAPIDNQIVQQNQIDSEEEEQDHQDWQVDTIWTNYCLIKSAIAVTALVVLVFVVLLIILVIKMLI